jgi:ankyrin repeat protein
MHVHKQVDDLGFEVRLPSSVGSQFLMHASLVGDVNIVKILLSHGADVNIM